MLAQLRKMTLALSIGMLSIGGVACAAPNISGETGNLVSPNADFMKQGEFHIAYLKAGSVHGYAAAIALDDRLELSAKHQDKDTLMNLKYSILEETVATPGVAVGVSDVTGKYDRSYYCAVSKTLPLGLRLHGGIGTKAYNKGMLALEANLNPTGIPGVFPDTSLFVEHVNDEFAYGLRVSVIRGLKASVTRYGHTNFLGVSYNFY